MTRAIKLTVLIMIGVLPYLYGEYSYRQHLGTQSIQCIKTWEQEYCHKGHNCRYESQALMLFDNGTTSTFVGTYNIGSTYQTEKEWKIFDHTAENEPSTIADIAQIYRFLVNGILACFLGASALFLVISTFVWLAFKTRYKNPLSFWIMFWNDEGNPFDIDSQNDKRRNKFMDEHPFWFYKEER